MVVSIHCVDYINQTQVIILGSYAISSLSVESSCPFQIHTFQKIFILGQPHLDKYCLISKINSYYLYCTRSGQHDARIVSYNYLHNLFSSSFRPSFSIHNHWFTCFQVLIIEWHLFSIFALFSIFTEQNTWCKKTYNRM